LSEQLVVVKHQVLFVRASAELTGVGLSMHGISSTAEQQDPSSGK